MGSIFRRYLSHPWDFHHLGSFLTYLTMGGNDFDVFGFTMITLALVFYQSPGVICLNLFLRVGLDWNWIGIEIGLYLKKKQYGLVPS